MSFERIPRLVERSTLTSRYSTARLLEKICPCGVVLIRNQPLEFRGVFVETFTGWMGHYPLKPFVG